jgi:hypothetical protein
MKRTSLTTAVIAGLAGVAGISNMANAVYLNGDGLGQVLIYPYYTVRNGNSTALTVVNTTNAGKAVKVRFLEGYNSREVLDFNLYMSPHDVWVAQIVPVGSGAGIYTPDNSCTVPPLPHTSAAAFPFSSYGYDGHYASIPADGGPTSIDRTKEGYLEMIEMGTVTNANYNSLNAITHNLNGVPPGCQQVNDAWTSNSANPYWLINNSFDITAASGGLFGSGTVVNVPLGTIEGYNAEAVDNFWLAGSFFHSDPGSLLPALYTGDSLTSYVYTATATSGAGAAVIGTVYSALAADRASPVTSLFMADTLYNEYWTSTGNFKVDSEWVITFPTKRFFVDAYSAGGPVPRKPFDVAFNKTVGTNGVAGSSCSTIGVGFFDREEQHPGLAPGNICPSPIQCGPVVLPTQLCYEVNTVTWNQPQPAAYKASTILGSNLAVDIETGYTNGWASLDMTNGASAQRQLTSQASQNVFNGLPGAGFWVTQFVNGNLGGVLANYTSLYRHKLHRACTRAAGVCS